MSLIELKKQKKTKKTYLKTPLFFGTTVWESIHEKLSCLCVTKVLLRSKLKESMVGLDSKSESKSLNQVRTAVGKLPMRVKW